MGEKRRYNGSDKLSVAVADILCREFNCISLCPEYAIGLGVPRDPIQLQLDSRQNVCGMTTGDLDISDRIRQYAQDIKMELGDLSGYVFKSRSPSCALNSAPLYDTRGQFLKKTDGIYAATLLEWFADLPVCEETELLSTANLERFIHKIREHHASRVGRRRK